MYIALQPPFKSSHYISVMYIALQPPFTSSHYNSVGKKLNCLKVFWNLVVVNDQIVSSLQLEVDLSYPQFINST